MAEQQNMQSMASTEGGIVNNTELAQTILDAVFDNLRFEHTKNFMLERAKHEDPRTNIYYMGGKKAVEYQQDLLKELAERFGLRYGPPRERHLKLIVDNKKAGDRNTGL